MEPACRLQPRWGGVGERERGERQRETEKEKREKETEKERDRERLREKEKEKRWKEIKGERERETGREGERGRESKSDGGRAGFSSEFWHGVLHPHMDHHHIVGAEILPPTIKPDLHADTPSLHNQSH